MLPRAGKSFILPLSVPHQAHGNTLCSHLPHRRCGFHVKLRPRDMLGSCHLLKSSWEPQIHPTLDSPLTLTQIGAGTASFLIMAPKSLAFLPSGPLSDWAYPASETVGVGMCGSVTLAPQESFRVCGYTLHSPQNLGCHISKLFLCIFIFPLRQ